MNRWRNNLSRVLAILLVCIMCVTLFAGCSNATVKSNGYRSVNGAILDSQRVASNDNYELSWDKDAKAVVFKDSKAGEYWSDILYDAFLDGSTSANGNSPISITVANTKTLKWDTVTSYSQMDSRGNILCKKLDNGIRVTYFFDVYKIAIPVDYTLNDGALKISIDSSRILEDGTDYKLVSISVAPNLCSVKNDADQGSLFVPSGSGAIMYTAENANGTREYVGEVYGSDAARRNPVNLTDSESIKLPVFGAYGDSVGLMGIIEEGAASCEILAKAGNARLGYSMIGAVFYVRGYDQFSYTYHGDYKGITTRVSEEISGQTLSISYHPLYGDKANYNGIAEKYRNYLLEKDLLIETKESASAYSVTMLGGTGITTSLFGVPNKELVSLTTFSQAKSIVEKLNKNIGVMPYIRMSGYGDNGIAFGSVAGGKKYPGVYGSVNDVKSLSGFCKDTGLFFDYEIVNFSKSGSGFSINSDTAKTAISYKAEHFPVSPIRVNDEDNVYYTISRNSLKEAANLALEKAQSYGINAISFSSLGSTAFSDSDYISKYKIESDVIGILKNIKSSKKSVAVANANVYAACVADVLFDTATNAGGWDALDLEIPFYQMVFHSYKPMYSQAVNLTENIDLAVAKAVAFGMGIGYTLTNGYVDKSDDLGEYRLYGTVYDDNADDIYDVIINKGYKNIFDSVCDAELISYEIFDNGLSVSKFSNGKIVYVNQTASTIDSPVGKLSSYEFSIA